MGQINILADGLRIDSTKIQLTEQDRFCDHVLSADGGMYLRAVRAAFAPHRTLIFPSTMSGRFNVDSDFS